jgi:hypothetical protein
VTGLGVWHEPLTGPGHGSIRTAGGAGGKALLPARPRVAAARVRGAGVAAGIRRAGPGSGAGPGSRAGPSCDRFSLRPAVLLLSAGKKAGRCEGDALTSKLFVTVIIRCRQFRNLRTPAVRIWVPPRLWGCTSGLLRICDRGHPARRPCPAAAPHPRPSFSQCRGVSF